MAETETPTPNATQIPKPTHIPKRKKKAPTPKAAGKKTCSIEGCKRAYRAKSLCFFHYKKWRRGELDKWPARYDTCGKEGCKKKVAEHGLCQEHFGAWKASRKSAKLAAAPAAPAAAAG
jgi:hypothetical protein